MNFPHVGQLFIPSFGSLCARRFCRAFLLSGFSRRYLRRRAAPWRLDFFELLSLRCARRLASHSSSPW